VSKPDVPPRGLWSALSGYAFSQGWVDAGGVRTRYLHTGTSGKPALVMLHVRDFLDAVRLAKASILGTSYGSRVAARFVVNYPDRVDKVILVSPGGLRYVPEDSEKIRHSSLQAIEDLSWSSNRGRLEGLMKDPAVVTDDMVACRLQIYAQPEFQKVKHRNLVAHTPEAGPLSLISEDEYRGIEAPTLIVRGVKDDGHDLRGAGRIAELIPKSSYVLMKNVGHWPYYEHPDEFNALALKFLREA
jgi:2-hydroxy-6-oxonona-2,4-dienedioate hydrolase